MADTSKPLLPPADPSAIFSDQTSRRSASEPSDGFLAVDIGALSMLAGDETEPAAGSQPFSPATSSFRKGSQRSGGGSGGERKAAKGETVNPTGGTGLGEKMAVRVHVAEEGEHNRLLHSPAPALAAGGKSRRQGRRPAPWLDPRRVLLVFATLSSIGTLILLYFTLSMSKMAGRGTDVQ